MRCQELFGNLRPGFFKSTERDGLKDLKDADR